MKVKLPMASTVTDSRRKFPVLLLAVIVIFILLATAVHGKDLDGGCIGRVGDHETPVPGSCLCYAKCAHKGEDKAGLTDGHAQTCFVHCVLKDSGWDVFSPAAISPAPPLVPEAGLLLSKTVRLAVTRPRVSRSRKEKEETEELLFVELGFEPGIAGGIPTHVFLNLPEGGEKQFRSLSKKTNHRYVDTIMAYGAETVDKNRAVRKFPIGGKLEALGADGDETVVVSLVPFVFEDVPHPYWYESDMVVVRSVRVVYEPKELYLDN